MRPLLAAAFAVTCALAACGTPLDAYCAKGKECAAKAGTAYSETKCKTDNLTLREQAQTLGCAGQWDELVSCYAGVPCTFTDAQIQAECGAKLNAYNKCVQ